MTDRPILFSAPMVRALLDGRKTQTRRVLKPQPGLVGGPFYQPHPTTDPAQWHSISRDGYITNIQKVRYSVGDRLWVRESGELIREARAGRPPADSDEWCVVGWRHTADGYVVGWNGHDPAYIDDYSIDSRPSIHMPRWASRLTLIVETVKVERLQEISEADARAEGVLYVPGHGEISPADLSEGYSNYLNCRMGFEELWNDLHGPGAWEANPWVVAIGFRVVRGNIDVVKEMQK